MGGLSWWDWLWIALVTLGVLVLVGVPVLRWWHGQDPFEGRR